MGIIRLLLVDDHALSRESVGRILALEPDFEVVAQCSNATDALEALKQSEVDVVLLDLHLGNDHGTQFIRACSAAGFPGTVLIVTAGVNASELMAAMQMGASGVFLKDNSLDTLGRAIRLVAGGGVWMDRKVIQLIATQIHQFDPRHSGKLLTDRERQVLQGVFEGLTNKKIATRIGVSEGTVKATLQQLFQKTQVRTRGQLVRAAIERSLLPTQPTGHAATPGESRP